MKEVWWGSRSRRWPERAGVRPPKGVATGVEKEPYLPPLQVAIVYSTAFLEWSY